jgi:hypothetical protein
MPVVAEPEPRRTRSRGWLWLLAVPVLLLVVLLGVVGYSFVRPVEWEWNGIVVSVHGRASHEEPGWRQVDASLPVNSTIGSSSFPLLGQAYVVERGGLHARILNTGFRSWVVFWFRGHRAK